MTGPPSLWRSLAGTRLLWLGLGLLFVGTVPLLLAVAIAKANGDSNPNPVGPGMLTMCTFWPGVTVTCAGLVLGVARWRRPESRGDGAK